MAFKYRCSKGVSRLSLDYRELEAMVDQFLRMNACKDLSTDSVQQLRYLALGLFISPRGLPTSAWVGVNKQAESHHLNFYLELVDRKQGLEDPQLQIAAARWVLSERSMLGAYEAIDPLDPFPTVTNASAAQGALQGGYHAV